MVYIDIPIYLYLFSEETKLFELVTGITTKFRYSRVTCYQINMRKWMVEFLNKSASRCYNIAGVT